VRGPDWARDALSPRSSTLAHPRRHLRVTLAGAPPSAAARRTRRSTPERRSRAHGATPSWPPPSHGGYCSARAAPPPPADLTRRRRVRAASGIELPVPGAARAPRGVRAGFGRSFSCRPRRRRTDRSRALPHVAHTRRRRLRRPPRLLPSPCRGAARESLARDVRHAWRSLWRTPLVTVLATVTLALGSARTRDVRGGQRRALPAAPLPRARPAGHAAQTRREGGTVEPTRWSYPEFVALRGAVTAFAHRRRVHRRRRERGRGRRGAGPRARGGGVGRLLPRARRACGGGAHLPARGGRRARHAPGRPPRRRALARPLRRGPARRGTDGGRERHRRSRSSACCRRGSAGSPGGGALGPAGHGAGRQLPRAALLGAALPQRRRPPRARPLARRGRARGGRCPPRARSARCTRARQATGTARGWARRLLPLDRARRDPTSLRAQVILLGAVGLVLLSRR
jgi:hypothetical protein